MTDQPQWAPVPSAPPRPPLDPRSRTGALIGGGLGFTLVSWGLGVVAFGVIAAFVAVVFGFIADGIRRWGRDGDGREFVRFVEAIPVWVVIVVVVVALLFGAALVVGGILAERAVLVRNGVHRPSAVLWSGLGIGLLANGLVGGIVSLPLSVGSHFGESDHWVPGRFVATAASGLIGLAVTVAVGALAAWWMAHAFRPERPAGRAAQAE